MYSSSMFDQFIAMLSCPIKNQRATLLRILERNKQTLYGRKYHFSKITDTSDFRKEVPLSYYKDLKPYINDCMDGHSNVLVTESIKCFFETSGTTSEPKFIPVTASFIESKAEAMDVYWTFVYKQFPALRTGQIVSNFSSAAQFKKTARGVLIGSETDYWNLLTSLTVESSIYKFY